MPAAAPDTATCPKIELHVHFEGAVAPATLLELARANGVAPPAEDAAALAALYEFRDFAHFVEVWKMTTNVMRRREDFTRVVLDYAAAAAAQGVVYIEGIFSPAERVARGVAWDDIFGGYCDGAERALAEHGVHVRLTPDVYRGLPLDQALEAARQSVRFRDRGVVGFGIGGDESAAPAAAYAEAFAIAREGGLAAVPHAGETQGPESVRAALDALGAVRLRHGVRAAEDPALVTELRERGIVLDVGITSNLATGAVASLEDHPLRALAAAGVACTVNTDDPAMFGTDIVREHELAARLGVSAADAYAAGLRGALCDESLREALAAIGVAAGLC